MSILSIIDNMLNKLTRFYHSKAKTSSIYLLKEGGLQYIVALSVDLVRFNYSLLLIFLGFLE